MELSWPLALLLLAAVVPAWWLARRSRGRSTTHPLWFLVEPGATQARRRRGRRSRFALVAAIALLALASSGPVRHRERGSRVLVVDESATRALDVDAVRARLRGYDEAVLVAPGRPPRRMTAAAAVAALAPSRGTITASELSDGVTAALARARTIDLAPAPPPGDDVAIARVAFHRDPLAPRRGRITIELALFGAASPPTSVVVRAGVTERGRATPVRAGGGAFAVVPYAGDGNELLAIALEPAAADHIALDDTATVTVPSLVPTPVWIDPALEGTAIARALSVVPTATRVTAPQADAIAVVPSTAWTGAARARIVVTPPPPDSSAEPLLAVAGSPLAGATPALLAATPAVAVAADAARAASDDRVWLRAGSHAAVWIDDADHPERAKRIEGPTLRIAAALDGPILPVVLADALASAPLAPAPSIAVAEVRRPPLTPAVSLPTSGDQRRGWPVRALLFAAAILIIAELLTTRPRRAGLALRAAALIGIALVGARAVESPHRRVVFVLDVSDSVAPAAATARDEVVRRASALGRHDRAALVAVAGGARLVIPPTAPSELAARARHLSLDPVALGLDPSHTDLRAGLALAAATLAGPGGDLVLVGDGRDSVQGAAAVRDAPELIGRGFTLIPIDTGEEVRLVASSLMVHAAPGRTFAVPVELEARVAQDVDVSVTHHGRVVGRRTLHVPAGRTRAAVDAVLEQPGSSELELRIAPDSPPVRVYVAVGGPGRTLRIDRGSTAALTDASLAGVDAVVLDAVPGGALEHDAIAAIDRFVASGGTLLWSAGPTTTAGDASRLAPLLPLRPTTGAHTAVLLLVDRSGSIDAAGRQAALPGAAELAAAAQTLSPEDRFGAIAFDTAAMDWIPLAPAGAGRTVPALPPARGGTDPSPALELARRRLATTPATMRRVAVLVTDGGFTASAERAIATTRTLAADGIRVEVIAIGALDDAARLRLTALAAAGGGRVHEPGAGVAAALPAVRVAPASDGVSSTARARSAWSNELGPVPAPLVAGAPLARHLVLEPSADAVVLADAGADPLLALRSHGAGRVLAWSADLNGSWIDPSVAAALIAAVATGSRDAITLEALRRSDRRTQDLRATLAVDRTTPMPARAIAGDGTITPLVLLPSAPGTLDARLESVAASTVIEAGGARLPLSPFEGEHDHLGADPDVAALERAASRSDHEAVWALVPLLGIGLILTVSLLLWLPER